MKKFRKNNKGFSLVELIVVVLIIAIIAVALAPQVIKWVGEARNNTARNNDATIQSAIQTCVAEYQATSAIADETAVTVQASGVTLDPANTTLNGLITAAVEGLSDSHKYEYKITTTGTVTTE